MGGYIDRIKRRGMIRGLQRAEIRYPGSLLILYRTHVGKGKQFLQFILFYMEARSGLCNPKSVEAGLYKDKQSKNNSLQKDHLINS